MCIAIAVGFFGAFQEGFRNWLLRICGVRLSECVFGLIISWLVALAIHSGLRMIWYSWLFRELLNAEPIERPEQTYLSQLHKEAEDATMKNHFGGRLIHWSGMGFNGVLLIVIVTLILNEFLLLLRCVKGC